jgi:hypothetical protein
MAKKAQQAKKESAAGGKVQGELDGMPSSALRDKIIEASDLKEQIGERSNVLKELMDDVKKLMRDEKKKHVVCEDDKGRQITVNLKSIGERVSIGKPKAAKETLPV